MARGFDWLLRVVANMYSLTAERSRHNPNAPLREAIILSDTITTSEDTTATVEESDTQVGIYPFTWGAHANEGTWGESNWN